MFRRTLGTVLLVLVAVLLAGCSRNKAQNPLADLDTKQPDKVLYDRALAALQRNKFDVARLTLQTLINTYPDSEFVARAKLTVGDTWYLEGGSAALAQAEIEYKDFITFFPNMPEAAEAQLKVADIHYKQMEKPDRDFTHAKRAEDEYRQMLLQFPDHALVEKAKDRLREVQEVLAEREFRIGQFYFRRESWMAAAARLKSVTDTYPLYSGADEALYLLGNAYEKQIEFARASQVSETAKGRLIQHLTDQAAAAYARIVGRYPAMYRAEDAKGRLEALKRPVPAPTPEAIAQNQAEEASRGRTGFVGRIMGNIQRGPDTAKAAKMGEPTMVDPQQSSAVSMARQITTALTEAAAGGGSVTAEVVGGSGDPRPSESAPRSAEPLRIAEPTSPSEGGDPLPPQIQVNDADQGGDPAQGAGASSSSQTQKDEKKNTSSSRKKKKKGLRKVIPF
ncbi:MAG: outer membrane protein assembly factor BamD [Acidobacteria bacterium]|nr:outer membrane protein assembly factor BamD [Acidobacteriota bacterium]